jgi:hypothetical protein
VFERTTSDLSFRIQQAALKTLRDGEALNPYLLRVLVDNRYEPYQPAGVSHSNLNAAQAEAFRRSLTVPDLLLVLGPPGTGKTKTIAGIAHAHAARRERVLVTAKNNKAVDNVLERLSGLTVIRTGHEDRVSEQVRDRLIDRQARHLQAQIIAQTESYAQRLAELMPHMDELKHSGSRLLGQMDQLMEMEEQLQNAQHARDTASRRIHALHGAEIQRRKNALTQQAWQLEHIEERLNLLAEEHQTAEARRSSRLLGWLWAWWSVYLASRIRRRSEEH